ncbi:MAG: hypothetical protein H0U18_08215 [Pyrinomonadaceae bacterium]|nr:hypothetical protein [Pyrinomonadaceae bacterium]
MLDSSVSRRSFVQSGLMFLLAARTMVASDPRGVSPRVQEVEVTLVGRAGNLGRELVSFGLPLPPGFLSNPRHVRVVTANAQEISAAVRALEPWRIGGREGSIHSLLIQFTSDFSRERTQRIKIVFQQKRRKNGSSFVPVAETLLEEDGLKGPRVLALLPARWLCDSLVVGPQTPVAESGPYRPYDQFVERNFPGSLAYLNSQAYADWLFDRTTAYYKMYVRSGERKFLEAAYHAAHFVRLHTKTDGPDAGIFTLKGPDLKYVYPRAMHIHYLLTGDERMRETGKIMAQYCLKNQHPVYQPSSITPSPLGADPERGRNFWTLRHQGYGLLGILHGWELTGDRAYWAKARECVDAYYKHQRQPPDGRPPDGSLRQDWGLYDPNEATFKGATSAWMMALLLDPLFHYWTLTGDHRVPEMVIKWCDFLDRQGMVPDGSKAYYVINCFAALDPKEQPSALGPDMEMHNLEMAYTFALGAYFTDDPKRLSIYRKRFDKLFPLAVTLDVNRPPRTFNWAFQFSSQLIYFMQHAGAARRRSRRMASEAHILNSGTDSLEAGG